MVVAVNVASVQFGSEEVRILVVESERCVEVIVVSADVDERASRHERSVVQDQHAEFERLLGKGVLGGLHMGAAAAEQVAAQLLSDAERSQRNTLSRRGSREGFASSAAGRAPRRMQRSASPRLPTLSWRGASASRPPKTWRMQLRTRRTTAECECNGWECMNSARRTLNAHHQAKAKHHA